MCQKTRKKSSREEKSNLPPRYFFTQSIPFILIPLKQNLLMSLAAKSTKHWWVFRMLLCLAWKTSSWLGNQHGKHTANIQRHFLCLATGKNLGCFFFCFYVMLLWSLGTMWLPQKEKEKDLLRLSSSMNLAWKRLYGDLRDWVTSQGKDREWAPPPVGPWLPPGPALQLRDLQHFLFWESWELTVFYEMNMTQKSIQHDLPMHFRVLSCTSHHRVFKPLFIETQLEPVDMYVFQATAMDPWPWTATVPGWRAYVGSERNSCLPKGILCGKWEKFMSTKRSSVNEKPVVIIWFNWTNINQAALAELCLYVCLAARPVGRVPWIWVQNFDPWFMSKGALLFNSRIIYWILCALHHPSF